MNEREFIEHDEESFFNDLGMKKRDFEILIADVIKGETTKAERLINGYRKHVSKLRRKGGRNATGSLHWNINRLYWSLEIKLYVDVGDMYFIGPRLRRKARIRLSPETVKNRDLWLIVAGVYVEGLKMKEEKLGSAAKLLKAPQPPQHWLDLIKGKKRSDFDLRTEEEIRAELPKEKKDQAGSIHAKESREKNMGRLIFDLANNWGRFVSDYEDPETHHGVQISGTSYGGFATLSQIEKGIIPARKKKIEKRFPYKLILKPEPEKCINPHSAPKRLSEYVLWDPSGLYASLNNERTYFLQKGASLNICEYLDVYLPFHLKVGINPQGYPWDFQAKKGGGEPCKNSKPRGVK